MPPLRARGEDIELLAEAFLKKFARQHNVAVKSLTPAAKQALNAYPFPGNVRELENIIERAVTLCAADSLDVDDLRLENVAGAPATAPPVEQAPARINVSASSGPLTPQLEDVERQAIVDALEKTRYNKTAAAKLLGLTFRQLRYRIKKLGIE